VNEIEDLPFEFHGGLGGARAGSGKLDGEFLPHVGWSCGKKVDSIGEENRLFYIVGDEKDRLTEFLPDR